MRAQNGQSTVEVVALRCETAGARFARLRVDGGATENDWLMQFQSDVLGVPVERPDVVETTALGAAGLAGIAEGIWSSAEEFIGVRSFRRFDPGEGTRAVRAGKEQWRRAVRAALSWARDRG